MRKERGEMAPAETFEMDGSICGGKTGDAGLHAPI